MYEMLNVEYFERVIFSSILVIVGFLIVCFTETEFKNESLIDIISTRVERNDNYTAKVVSFPAIKKKKKTTNMSQELKITILVSKLVGDNGLMYYYTRYATRSVKWYVFSFSFFSNRVQSIRYVVNYLQLYCSSRRRRGRGQVDNLLL